MKNLVLFSFIFSATAGFSKEDYRLKKDDLNKCRFGEPGKKDNGSSEFLVIQLCESKNSKLQYLELISSKSDEKSFYVRMTLQEKKKGDVEPLGVNITNYQGGLIYLSPGKNADFALERTVSLEIKTVFGGQPPEARQPSVTATLYINGKQVDGGDFEFKKAPAVKP